MVKVDQYLHYQRSLHMDYEYTSSAIADYEEILKMRSLAQAWLEYVIGDGSNTLEVWNY